MVRLNKSPLPHGVTIKSETDYREGEVLRILCDDCLDKCYICEEYPSTVNIEHRIPHRGNPALKFDWNNLFLSCGHCNKIKHDKFDNIIDPTKCDPEKHMIFSVYFDDGIVCKVKVDPLSTDEATLQTVELLELVYNGGSDNIKKIESDSIRKHLTKQIRSLSQLIKGYQDEPDLDYSNSFLCEIDRSAEFAAFKRKIVRDDPDLSKEFAEALD